MPLLPHPDGRPAGTGSRPELIRRHNLGTLLSHVHLEGHLLRSDLTHLMGVNRSTVGALVAELVDLGLLVESTSGRGGSGAGRPSLQVGVRADAAVVLSVDIRVERLVVAMVGLGGAVIARRQVDLAPLPAPGTVCELAAAQMRDLLSRCRAHCRLVGVGVSVPGLVHAADGRVRVAPNMGWQDVDLASLVAERLGGCVEVSVGNDADHGVVAEHLRGAGRGTRNVIYLTADYGVGAGIICDGRLLSGFGGYVGELGHLVVDPRGRRCRCGRRGCWETEVGQSALADALGLPGARMDDLVRAVQGSPRTPGLRRVARFAAQGLIDLLNVLNPEVVVLGGLLGAVHALLGESLEEAVRAGAFRAVAEGVRLTQPGLGADSSLVGAAEAAFAGLLADPAATFGGVHGNAPRVAGVL